MKMYREVVVRTDHASASEVLEAIEARLSDGWRRDRESEKGVEADAMYCFLCSARGAREAAALWLTRREDGSLWVANVVPEERGELTRDQYNGIVEEFVHRFARPAAEEVGVELELSPGDAQIDDLAGPVVAERLRAFTRVANRFAGASHPLDRARWNRFVIAAHEARSPLTPEDLRRWLVEEEGWPEDVADELAVQYEYARSLLTERDREARHAAGHH